MNAVIMAGGAGQRLRPLTCKEPKPMVPVMNTPVMEHTLALLQKHEVGEVAVTLQYLPERIKNYFGDEMHGVKLTYVVEDQPLGTAGSVLNTGKQNDTLLVISGDALTDLDITAALAFHKSKGADATIVLKRVPIPLEYGVVIVDPEAKIERFVEKPDWSEVFGDLVNTGIYLLEPNVWEGFKAGENFDFAKNVFPRLLERNARMYGFVTQDYWCDIGSVEQYVSAHRDIFDGKCRLTIQKAQDIDGVWIEEGAKIHSASVIKGPCYIGADAVIAEGAAIEPYSVIGSGVKVDGGASIKRSIIWENSHMSAYAEVRGAVLCSNVEVHRGAAVFEQAVIADGVHIGQKSIVSTNVRVWPDKHVDAGDTITSDCIWGNCNSKLFVETGIRGGFKELSPEMMCRLGRTIALELGQNARVGVAADGSPECVLLKQALAAGLMAGGADVFDLECTVKPVVRFGISSLSLSAAVYLRRIEDTVSLELIDRDALDMSAGKLRSIRSAFEQGRETVLERGSLGLLRVRTNIEGFYIASVLSSIDVRAMREGAKRVIIIAQDTQSRELCEELFAACGWGVVNAATVEEARKLSRKLNAVALNIGQEKFAIYSGSETVEGGRLDMLLALMELRAGAKELVCDALSPDTIEQMALLYGAQVKRMHTQKLLKEIKRTGLLFAVKTDPFAAAVRLCEKLVLDDATLTELANALPQVNVRERSIACAWKDIGRIFRTISDEQAGANMERLEGLRIRSRNGWVHLLPGSDGRRLRVIGGAFSEEYAESLADLYAKRASALCEEDSL